MYGLCCAQGPRAFGIRIGIEGVRLPPSTLIFGRIISALQDRFPNVSTFAAWGLRRIQRDCLFKDVAGHP